MTVRAWREPRAPERLDSARLFYRRPTMADIETIYTRYASDPAVTKYLSWLRHTGLDDTRVFISFSNHEWRDWGCGPYLICAHEDGRVLGSTGLAFDTPEVASTGYVLARDAWGQGYASEALRAMIDLARSLDVRRLYAVCHVQHDASRRVMEKCGFVREGILRRHTTFPNLAPTREDVLCYSYPFALEQQSGIR